MMNGQITHDCRQELKAASLKATPARLSLLKFLEVNDKPVDIATLNKSLKKNNLQIDDATVFRIINLFTQKGLIKQIYLDEGKSRYELASKDEHHHFICQNCRMIEDINDCNVGSLISEIERKKHFKVKSHSLEFYGLCQSCQK